MQRDIVANNIKNVLVLNSSKIILFNWDQLASLHLINFAIYIQNKRNKNEQMFLFKKGRLKIFLTL